MAITNITLLQGIIGFDFTDTMLMNDFESMATGTTTVITGWTVTGLFTFGAAVFFTS